MEFTVSGRQVTINFNYLTMFKVNKELSTKDENGFPNGDGVGSLFYRVVDRNDQAIVDLIRICGKGGKKELSEEAILEAIAERLEDEESAEGLFVELETEMVESGFFKDKILKYIDNMELSLQLLEKQEGTSEAQVEMLKGIIGKMKNAVS